MNLSLLVGSCDKYEFIWDKFFTLFDKYWDHSLKINKYFLTETIPAIHDNFIPITSNYDYWSEQVKSALPVIQTDYILWMQDDYFLRKTITKDQFIKYLDFITNNDVDRFGIHDDSYLYSCIKDINSSFYKFKQNSNYTISMQASIWKKSFFYSCLDQKPETAWQFELDGTSRLNLQHHKIFLDKQYPSWYQEALKQGKYTNDYFNICTEEKL